MAEADARLLQAGSTRDWRHLTRQRGMFCYSGLSAAEAERLTKQYSIYVSNDGRISIAGITTANVAYVARAIHEVTR